MALRFRNIEATPDDPVETWGVEGIATAIERGSLPHWAKITRAVRADPHGAAARDLRVALDVVEPSGIAQTLADILADAEAGERAEVARRVRRSVRRSGMTARDFAAAVGTSPSRLSTYASGKVVPSAAMFLRIERFGDRQAATAPLAAVRHGD